MTLPPGNSIRDATAGLVLTACLLTFVLHAEPVPFTHQKHEAVRHPERWSEACVGCHHKVERITAAHEFKSCVACHRAEGHPDNPEDKQGIELSSREANHRACIGCHRATVAATPTACRQCHPSGYAPPNPRAPDVPLEAQPQPDPVRSATLSSSSRATPVVSRWDLDFPDDPRRERSRGPLDPFHQNRLKGDFPIVRNRPLFLTLGAESDSQVNVRRLTGAIDPANAGTSLIDRGNQTAFRQNVQFSFDLTSKGTAFRPAAWRIFLSPVFNFSTLDTQRTGIVNVDPARGTGRRKADVALQAAFTEVRLGDTPEVFPFLRGAQGVRKDSPYLDSTALRTGIQPFVSDFRGFLFSDVNLGTRLFGNAGNNRWQYNVALFRMLEKNVNSELNSPRLRNQTVVVANIYRQDPWGLQGYNAQWSVHFNHDGPGLHTDENGFVTRATRHAINAVYLGWAGDGHIGPLNITHAIYQALGTDSLNPLAGRPVNINAQFAAAEASLSHDWLRFKTGFLFASGDGSPGDSRARGFDSIVDAPEFAGGRFSFWNQQGLRLSRTSANLVSPNSILPSLRGNKFASQANFVNPGLLLSHAGVEADLTTKLRAVANFSYLAFHHTEPLAIFTGGPPPPRGIGFDSGIGLRYRPFLTDHTIIEAGYATLSGGEALRRIYRATPGQSALLQSGFVRIRWVY